MAELNLTIIEIIVLQVGAIILGIAIHFFITSRRSLEPSSNKTKKLQRQFEDWKMKYFNEAEIKDRELAESRMLMKAYIASNLCGATHFMSAVPANLPIVNSKRLPDRR